MRGEWLQDHVNEWDTVDDGKDDRAGDDEGGEVDCVGERGEEKCRKKGDEELC